MSGYRLRHSREPFCGAVRLPGSKHELAHALAIACMQPSGAISNVAETEDSSTLVDCLKLIFERVTMEQKVLSFSHPRSPSRLRLPATLTARSRNIYCLLPALLKWSQSVTMEGVPTGCPFEYRPHQWYFETLEKAGVEIRWLGEGVIDLQWPARRGSTFTFAYPSVTATILALAVGTQSESETVIYGASQEPSAMRALHLARDLGHTVEFKGRVFRVVGAPSDRSVSTTIGPDLEVAATLLAGLVMAGGRLLLETRSVVDSAPLRGLFGSLGVVFTDTDAGLVATYEAGSPLPPVQRYFGSAPLTPSDWSPMLAMAILSHSQGESVLVDTLFADRFDYLLTSPAPLRASFKLTRSEIGTRSCANLRVSHPLICRLKGDSYYTPRDLRGAAASVISCLRSDGWVHLTDDSQLRRGYEDLVGDLGQLTRLEVEPLDGVA